ncbi:MAG: galactokinase [Bryobacteraceae bacterium]
MAGASRQLTFRAPGRVNLIGEHTDYNAGFVLPMALGLDCRATFVPAAQAANGNALLRAWSNNLSLARQWTLDELRQARPSGDWSDYVAGVAQQLIRAGCKLSGGEILIQSDVPIGSGLSSSASLEVAVALALLDSRKMDPIEVAHLCHRAENEFVGLPCGIMDHFASLFGRRDHALLLDCRDLSSRAVPIPRNVTFLAVNSMVKHELGNTAYATRVRECAAAARVFGVESLRDLGLDRLDSGECEGTPLRRARHVVTENQRVLDFVAACERGESAAMGRLMVESHISLRDDYEVSCTELDFLAATALQLPGVHGARMTGGGFGGCTVNLIDPAAEPEFRARIAEEYQARFGRAPEVHACRPSCGAGPDHQR